MFKKETLAETETWVKILLDQNANSPPLRNYFSSHVKLHEYSRIISLFITKCKRKDLLQALLSERNYFKSEEEFIQIAVKYSPLILEFASSAIKANKSTVLAAVRIDGLALEFADYKLQDDVVIALEAIKQNGQALRFTQNLRNNKQIVLEAVSRCGWIVQFASEILKLDRDVIKKAVEQNGHVFNLFITDQHLKSDPELIEISRLTLTDEKLKEVKILEIESNDAYDTEYLVPFKSPTEAVPKRNPSYFLSGCFNRNLVLEAVIKQGESFCTAAPQFKKDKEIVIEAVRQFPYLIQYADRSLSEDCDIALVGVKKDGRTLCYYGRAPRMNRQVALAAVFQNGRSIAYVDASLKEDCEIVKAAFSNKGRALRFTPPSIQKNRELVLLAVQNNGRAIEYASDDLREDRELVFEAVKQCGRALIHAHPKFMCDKTIIITALSDRKKGASHLFQRLNQRFKGDPDVVEAALNGGEGLLCSYSIKMDLFLDIDFVVNRLKNVN